MGYLLAVTPLRLKRGDKMLITCKRILGFTLVQILWPWLVVEHRYGQFGPIYDVSYGQSGHGYNMVCVVVMKVRNEQ